MGSGGPMTAGPPESSPQAWTPSVPPADDCLVMGTRAYMISSSTFHVRAACSGIEILLDNLRLALRSRLRLPGIDDVGKPLKAHQTMGSPERARLLEGRRATKSLLLVFGIVALIMGANSAFAQT